MAYLDLHDVFAAPAGGRAAAPATSGDDAAFSPLEWNVIALARRDPLRSVARPGRLSRAMGSLFGLGTVSTLADPRLEALRRLAVHAWHHDFALPAEEVARFLAAGFSEAQAETLVASVTGLRVGRPERRLAA